MPFSISNSKLSSPGGGISFPLLVVFVSTVFLLGYSFLIYCFPNPSFIGQNLQQENMIRVQNFLYRTEPLSATILGSSMSAGIPLEGQTILSSVAVSGGTARTGAQIIIQSKRYPKIAFVESSLSILRAVDQDFIRRALHPISHTLKKRIPALREVEQPVNRLYRLFGERLEPVDNVLTDELRDIQIQRRIKEFSTFSKQPEEIRVILSAFGAQIDEIRSHGSRIVFFEFPLDIRLHDLPLWVAVRGAFHQRFPSDQYEWVSLPAIPPFETVDGVHLRKESAIRLGSFLSRTAKNLN